MLLYTIFIRTACLLLSTKPNRAYFLIPDTGRKGKGIRDSATELSA